MNEMQAHGLLIPVGSKPFEVWIDKNNSLAELQDLVNGNVDVLSVLGNGVDLWVNEEGLIGDDRQAERDLCGPVHRLQRVYSH